MLGHLMQCSNLEQSAVFRFSKKNHSEKMLEQIVPLRRTVRGPSGRRWKSS